jgi:hypothetical protein
MKAEEGGKDWDGTGGGHRVVMDCPHCEKGEPLVDHQEALAAIL